MNRQDDCSDEQRKGAGTGGERPQGGSERRDHMDDTVSMWRRAAERAWYELHVEMLKERFRKAHGENIGAVADRIVVSLHAEWKAHGSVEVADRMFRSAVSDGFQKGPQ